MRVDKAWKNRGLAEVLPVCIRKCRVERHSIVDRLYLAPHNRYRAIFDGRRRNRQDPASAVESGHFVPPAKRFFLVCAGLSALALLRLQLADRSVSLINRGHQAGEEESGARPPRSKERRVLSWSALTSQLFNTWAS